MKGTTIGIWLAVLAACYALAKWLHVDPQIIIDFVKKLMGGAQA